MCVSVTAPAPSKIIPQVNNPKITRCSGIPYRRQSIGQKLGRYKNWQLETPRDWKNDISTGPAKIRAKARAATCATMRAANNQRSNSDTNAGSKRTATKKNSNRLK